ncbi:unannotated protein [freshwater metagenome]|uniref:Unannotated protein n=1 Tax=freshwater metagenome TaxID=449393 RepID=A0A6J7SCD4_9ZZZZ
MVSVTEQVEPGGTVSVLVWPFVRENGESGRGEPLQATAKLNDPESPGAGSTTFLVTLKSAPILSLTSFEFSLIFDTPEALKSA